MNKANTFMAAGWVGLAAITTFIVASFAPQLEPVAKPAALLTFVSCWVMLFTRKADEYTLALWTTAASFAFGTLLLLFLGLPFAEGFIDGVQKGMRDQPNGTTEMDVTAEGIVMIAVAAFYVGLIWKRLRGDF